MNAFPHAGAVRIDGEVFDLAACSRFAEADCCAPHKRAFILRTNDNRYLRVIASDRGAIDQASTIDADTAARVRHGWSALWSQPTAEAHAAGS